MENNRWSQEVHEAHEVSILPSLWLILRLLQARHQKLSRWIGGVAGIYTTPYPENISSFTYLVKYRKTNLDTVELLVEASTGQTSQLFTNKKNNSYKNKPHYLNAQPYNMLVNSSECIRVSF
jgi:hypothetical protein